MSDPNKLGNGNNGDSSFEDSWDDRNNDDSSFEDRWKDNMKNRLEKSRRALDRLENDDLNIKNRLEELRRSLERLERLENGDLIDGASDNNVDPLKSSKIDIVDDADDDFEEVDLYSNNINDGSTNNVSDQEPVIVVGQGDLKDGRVSDKFLSSIDGAQAYYRNNRINKLNNVGDKDDAKINNDDEGVPVTGQPNKPSDSKDTVKDGVDNDTDSRVNRMDTNGNKVRSIMDRFKKTGIGKLFVGACIVTALVGMFGATHQNGFKNGEASATAKIESQLNAGSNENQEDGTGSEGATNQLDEIATASSTEKSAEKLNTNADVRYVDGEVFTDVNQEFGGDNTGADLLDNKNIESTHADPLTNKLAKWVDNEGNVFEAAQANPEAQAAFKLEVNSEINRRIGNIAPLVQEGYVLGYFGEGDNINNANMTQTGYEFSTDSNEYQNKKELIQADYINRVGEKTYKIGLLRKGQHYASIGARKIVNPDDTARPNFFSDNDVNASINGTMYLEEFDAASGLNYYDAHPEIKERVLRVLDLIKTGASEDAIQDTMNSWTIIRLPGCMQYGALKKTPEPTPNKNITPTPDKDITPTPDKDITPTPDKDITPTPDKEITPTPDKEITPTPNKNITPTPDKEITPTPDKDITPTPDKKITPTPDKDITPTPKDNPKDNETPKDNPKDNEKVLESKTDNVRGANEFDTQKINTVTDQTVEATLGSEQENARVETAGAEVGDKAVEEKEVVEEFSTKDESGMENADKTLDQVENNENLNTGTSEKQSDAEAKETVEEAKESTEKAPTASYDLDYASADWDFSNFGN